jgi:hypothetical protein
MPQLDRTTCIGTASRVVELNHDAAEPVPHGLISFRMS